MNDEVKKIIKESYKRLPFDLKKAIVSSETRQHIQAVVEKHQLNSDQAADLETEIAIVLLGLRSPADFIVNVKNALNVPAEKARAIADDINTEIFRPIRESLKKIHGISETPTSPLKPELASRVPTPRPQGASGVGTPTPPVVGTSTKELPPPEDETKLNREEILEGIENPAPARTASEASKTGTGNIVQDKLAGMVRMPLSEEEVRSTNYEVDPYREPLK